MTCELSGKTECPVLAIAQQLNGKRLQYDAIGTRISNSTDREEVLQLGTQAGEMRQEIEGLEIKKNSINRCRICPVV